MIGVADPGPEISTAAAAVLADLYERAVRRHLGLAGTHLIERGSTDGRWRMHDLIRLYAAEKRSDGTDDAWATMLGPMFADVALRLWRYFELRRRINAGRLHIHGDRRPRGEGTALNNLGGLLRLQDRGREAIPMLRKAVDALTDVDDAHSRGPALVNLGQVLSRCSRRAGSRNWSAPQ